MAPKIAIVDDDPESRLLLQGHLDRYASETHRDFQVESYAQGSAFLQNWAKT